MAPTEPPLSSAAAVAGLIGKDANAVIGAEKVTVGKRAGYYDTSGVLRDMFQSHLLQVLTMVAMEPPSKFTADRLRNEKVKVLDAILVPSAEEARCCLAIGQYAGYLKEKDVPPDSRTPTYAACKLAVENWRWKGVPFYLRSGKGLRSRYSEVTIQFREPPFRLFAGSPDAPAGALPVAMVVPQLDSERARFGRASLGDFAADADASRTADDAARYRLPEEVQARWKEEPIARLRAYLVSQKACGKAQEEELAAECQKAIEAAIERYLASSPRVPETMFDHLYAELPRTYASQRAELSGERDA